MSKPYIHALSSVKKYGGKVEDYLPIHELMDSSKAIVADNRHRVFTHNSWFIATIIPKIFGETFTNSEGKVISSRDIAEQHVLEDYAMRFIPTAQDFLEEMGLLAWMQNGMGTPPSAKKILDKHSNSVIEISKSKIKIIED
jgi:hypothetical protein